MPPFTAVFELPTDIAGGLATGQLIRTGGVIQRAAGGPGAGEIVMWLREASAQPVEAANLAASVGNQAASLLGLAGNVACVLNLGATVGFGIATLRKLNRMDGKLDALGRQLDALDRKLDQLQWTADVGFASLTQRLESVTFPSRHGGGRQAAERCRAALDRSAHGARLGRARRRAWPRVRGCDLRRESPADAGRKRV